MKMITKVLQNLSLNRTAALVMASIAMSIASCFANNQQNRLEVCESPALRNISYIYALSYDTQGKVECIGNLECDVVVPDNADRLLFLRTNGRVDHKGEPFFCLKTPYPATTKTISKTNIKWNDCFSIYAFYPDNSGIMSPAYYVKDYIDPEDLLKILGQSQISDPSSFENKFYIKALVSLKKC